MFIFCVAFLSSWGALAGTHAVHVLGIVFSDSKLTPSDRDFIPLSQLPSKTIGYQNHALWAKVEVSNFESNSLFVIKNPLIWYSDIISRDVELVPFSNFPLPSFKMPEGKDKELFYVRLKSDAALNVDFEVMSPQQFRKMTITYTVLYVAYGTTVLFISFLFLVYFFNTKKRIALIYSALLFSFHFFAILSTFGFPSALLPSSYAYLGTFFLVTSECLACITTILFTNAIVRKNNNQWENGLILLGFATAALSLFVQNIYMMSGTLVLCILTIATSLRTFYRFRAQNDYLTYYMIAFSVLSTGVTVYTIEYLGFTHEFTNRFFIFAGSLCELSIIAFVIIRILYKEQAQLQYYAASLNGLVSSSALTELIGNGNRLTFEKVSTDLTIMFVDIVGFTEASRQINTPEIFEKEVQELLQSIRNFIIESGGEINKSLGDGLLGYFGHSITGKKMENHTMAAVQCALRIQRASVVWINKYKFHYPFQLRIGLSVGACRVGNIASDRLDYAVTGDTVVTAQRMEAACSPFKVLVCENLYKFLDPSVGKVHVKLIQIKNQDQLTRSYEIDPFSELEDFRNHYEQAQIILRDSFKYKRDKSRRIPVTSSATFVVETPTLFKGEIVNISETGFLIKSSIDLGKNIQLLGSLLDKRIGVTTRWSTQVENDMYFIGVEFIKINGQDIDYIYKQLTSNPMSNVA